MNMTYSQLLVKHDLALDLYSKANNVIKFESVQENKEELLKNLKMLSNKNLIIVDLHESRFGTKHQTQ